MHLSPTSKLGYLSFKTFCIFLIIHTIDFGGFTRNAIEALYVGHFSAS